MITDEATIMHTAAVLAAAQYSANKAAADGGKTPSFKDSERVNDFDTSGIGI